MLIFNMLRMIIKFVLYTEKGFIVNIKKGQVEFCKSPMNAYLFSRQNIADKVSKYIEEDEGIENEVIELKLGKVAL